MLYANNWANRAKRWQQYMKHRARVGAVGQAFWQSIEQLDRVTCNYGAEEDTYPWLFRRYRHFGQAPEGSLEAEKAKLLAAWERGEDTKLQAHIDAIVAYDKAERDKPWQARVRDYFSREHAQKVRDITHRRRLVIATQLHCFNRRSDGYRAFTSKTRQVIAPQSQGKHNPFATEGWDITDQVNKLSWFDPLRSAASRVLSFLQDTVQRTLLGLHVDCAPDEGGSVEREAELKEEQRLRQESERRAKAAEAEVQQLRRELAEERRLRQESERRLEVAERRAEVAAQRAQEAKAKYEEERASRQALEQRLLVAEKRFQQMTRTVQSARRSGWAKISGVFNPAAAADHVVMPADPDAPLDETYETKSTDSDYSAG